MLGERVRSAWRVAASQFHRLLSERRAVAAVEFAVILPLVIVIYVGASELSQATMTSSKVETIANTLAQIASKQVTSPAGFSSDAALSSTTPPSVLSSIMDAGVVIMAPASAAPLKMVLTAVDISNKTDGTCCRATVRWSYAQAAKPRPCGELTQVPNASAPSPSTIASSIIPAVNALMPGADGFARVSVLVADVSYAYQPTFTSQWITFPANFGRTAYMFPRGTEQVVVPGAGPSGGPMAPTSANRTGYICY